MPDITEVTRPSAEEALRNISFLVNMHGYEEELFPLVQMYTYYALGVDPDPLHYYDLRTLNEAIDCILTHDDSGEMRDRPYHLKALWRLDQFRNFLFHYERELEQPCFDSIKPAFVNGVMVVSALPETIVRCFPIILENEQKVRMELLGGGIDTFLAVNRALDAEKMKISISFRCGSKGVYQNVSREDVFDVRDVFPD